MDVAMMPATGKAVEGDDEESSATAISPPPPIKEVNNNVLGSSACMGAEVAASSEASTEAAKAEAAAATVYSCGSVRVSVTAAVTPSAAAQWLCVARLPRDFTRAELLELVEEYGAVEDTHMIHSEKTGKQIANENRGCVNSPQSNQKFMHVSLSQSAEFHSLMARQETMGKD